MKTQSLPRRSFAAALSFVFIFTQVAFAHVPQTSLWQERRERAAAPATASALASAGFGAPPVLSAIADGLKGVSAIPSGAWASLSPAAAADPAVRSVVASLPASLGDVRRVHLAPNAKALVVHVLDVHRNPEVQANIAGALAALSKGGVSFIGLEGVFRSPDLSGFSRFPHRELLARTARALLDHSDIGGPLFAALTASRLAPIVGVDDRTAYDANVAAYRASVSRVSADKAVLAGAAADVNERKTTVFSASLTALDRRVAAYRAGQLSFPDYLSTLTEAAPDSVTPEVRAFLEVSRLEARLDFAAVEKERLQVCRDWRPVCRPRSPRIWWRWRRPSAPVNSGPRIFMADWNRSAPAPASAWPPRRPSTLTSNM